MGDVQVDTDIGAASLLERSERKALKKVRIKLERASHLLAQREAEVASFAENCEKKVIESERELSRAREERDVLRVEATVAREALLVVEEENSRLREALKESESHREDETQKKLVTRTLEEVKEALELASEKLEKAEMESESLRKENNALTIEVKNLKQSLRRQGKILKQERRQRRALREKWRDATCRLGESFKMLRDENDLAAASLSEMREDRDTATRTIEELSAAAAEERQRRRDLEDNMEKIAFERREEREKIAEIERERAKALEKRIQLESDLCQELYATYENNDSDDEDGGQVDFDSAD